ncbi:MAG: hypothetical protein ACRC8S_01175 [Fimbriiglobus sp.]
MQRGWRFVGLLLLGVVGCAAVPPVDNPVLVRPYLNVGDAESPLLTVPGQPTPEGYAHVYERVLDAVDDYFDLKGGPRYSGQIETYPRIAAGYEQPWKYSSPDARERLLATFQTMRHYAIARISPGERGGFAVYVEVYKEMEDLSNPTGARNGMASFRQTPLVDRRIDGTDLSVPVSRNWIPMGRDPAYEQVILKKIQDKVCR